MTNKRKKTSDRVIPATRPSRLTVKPAANIIAGPNARLVGVPGSRRQLATPCLILELNCLQENINKMSSLVARTGKCLRPHAKAHKCVEIAKRQIRAGAIGICVATIGEAEVFFAGGITDVFLTSTFAPGPQIDRVVELANRGCALGVAVDNIDVVIALSNKLTKTNSRIKAFIDIDMGRKRSGCSSVQDALALAAVISEQQTLELVGMQTYAGHLSHMAQFEARRIAAIDKGFDSGIGFGQFVAGGITDVFLTSTFAPGPQIDRVVELANRGCALGVAVDNIDVVIALSNKLTKTNSRIKAFIDIDMGRKRSGCSSVQDALALAAVISEQQTLELVGMQTYAGHLSHMAQFEARRIAAIDCQSQIAEFKKALIDFCHRDLVCTGGSTGSLMLDLSDQVLDELQYGSYVFMDAEYLSVDPDGTGSWPFRPSLFVQTTVISANASGVVTTDGGDKRFANKYGVLPQIVDEAHSNSIYRPVSDEHGQIELLGSDGLAVGDTVECLIPHSDPTVNLFNQVHVVDHDSLLDIWPVDARGAF